MTSACNYNASATEAGYCAVFRVRDTTATVIALPMRTRMESATRLKWTDARTAARATTMRPRRTTTDHACLPDPGWTARAIACLTWMRTAFATKSEVTGCLDDIRLQLQRLSNGSGLLCCIPGSGYDCNGDCIADADADGICDAFEVDGCSDSSACNYDAAATDDDGSCVFAGSGLDCAGNCLFDVDADGVCDQSEVTGCLDDIRLQLQRLCYGSGLLRVFRIRDTTAAVIALPMRTRMESATRLKWTDARTAARATTMRPQRTTTDHACLPDPGWTARAIACLTWMRTAFATNPKSRAAWMTPRAITTPLPRKRAIACIPDSGYDCNGDCIADADADGICDAFEVRWLHRAIRPVNYNSEATEDDGSCVYGILGCTYAWATNYNPSRHGRRRVVPDNCGELQ